MRTDNPFPPDLLALGEAGQAEASWPPGDAAFTRLLLTLARLDPPPPEGPDGMPEAVALPPPDAAALPAPPAMPVFELPSGLPLLVDLPPPQVAEPPARAEELPPPLVEIWTPPALPEQPPAARPFLPPRPLLEQRWDAETGSLVWVRDGSPIGPVRGPALPPPMAEPPAATMPAVAPPPADLLLIA